MTICNDCGCEDVQVKKWVECNTDSVHEKVEGNEDKGYCPECELPVKLCDVNEPKWKAINALSREELVSELESIGGLL
jgi:hypothetical protein